MSAGTITLTNGSKAVTGAGVDFNTDLTAADFIIATVGGTVYSLAIDAIATADTLVLSLPFNGPTATGVAWQAVPRKTMLRVTAELNKQVTEALRLANENSINWQAVLSSPDTVTVVLPDGTTLTGYSWRKIVDMLGVLDIDTLQPLADQIHADAQQVATDKPIIVQAKDDAEAAAAAAAISEGNAETSETNAAASEQTAITKAAEAAESAKQAGASNPLLALQKSLNLSDLADRAAAWLNVRPIGATPLAADPVNPYDAATKRWAENLIGAGTTGPTMNGVMNFGVGQNIPWDSRAYIPPYCLPKDGQIVNRADWPELWAHAQQHGAIDDSVWIADVTQRGKYSKGNGTTTFRIPDMNGVQKNGVNGFTGANSIPATFFRGGESAADMTIKQNAAPNILTEMTVNFPGNGYVNVRGNNSAVYSAGNENVITALPAGTGSAPGWGNLTFFDASRANDAYGRNSTTEVYPNHVSGVWIVRASGGFVAANTSWSVINGDSTRPAANTNIAGGDIISRYNIGTAMEAEGKVKVFGTIGGAYGMRLSVTNTTKGVTKNFDFTDSGNIVTSGGFSGVGPVTVSLNGGTANNGSGATVAANNTGGSSTTGERNDGGIFNSSVRSQNAFFACREFVGQSTNGLIAVNVGSTWSNFYFRNNGSAYAENGGWVNGASDIRVKKDFKEINDPFSTMRKIKAGTWRMNTKNGGDRFGIGVLANGLYDDYPEAALTNGDQELTDGTVVKDVLTVQAGDSGVLAAVHHATLLKLMDKIEELEAEIKALKGE